MKTDATVRPHAYTAAMDRLEFKNAHDLYSDQSFTVQLSIAISLKRIADRFEEDRKATADAICGIAFEMRRVADALEAHNTEELRKAEAFNNYMRNTGYDAAIKSGA